VPIRRLTRSGADRLLLPWQNKKERIVMTMPKQMLTESGDRCIAPVANSALGSQISDQKSDIRNAFSPLLYRGFLLCTAKPNFFKTTPPVYIFIPPKADQRFYIPGLFRPTTEISDQKSDIRNVFSALLYRGFSRCTAKRNFLHPGIPCDPWLPPFGSRFPKQRYDAPAKNHLNRLKTT
jgi:hypothetical protein